MRYRPYGHAGAAVSNITLSIGLDAIVDGPTAAKEMIFSALEAGINSYRLESADPVLAEIVGQALGHVERRLIGVSLTLGAGDGRRGNERDFSAEGMTGAIDRALHVSGLGWIDLALLHEPGEDELPQSSLNALKALRQTGRVKLLGVSGEDPVMDTYVSTGAFDVLATPFHVNVGWQVRSRMRAARDQDMAIFAYDYFPDSLNTPKKAGSANDGKKMGLFGFGKKTEALPETATFAFLHKTAHWDAESVCLAYALTDTSVSTVIVRTRDSERIAYLAAIPERDMPPGLAAQIEMARISTAA